MKCRVSAWACTAAASALAFFAICGRASSRADGPSPVVECVVEAVRKIPQGYLVAPTAVIPFIARVRDPHGLKHMEYVVTTARHLESGRFGPEDKEQKVPAMSFVRPQQQREGQLSPLLVPEFRTTGVDVTSTLDLSKLPRPLPAAGVDKPTPRYRVRVCLEATNDAANDPRSGRGEVFTFLVVPEVELLIEIAAEEEILESGLHDWGVNRLRQAQSRLHELNKQLPAAKAADVDALAARAMEIRTTVALASVYCHDSHTTFRRILSELKANRVRADMIERVEKTVCGPMDELLRRDFDAAVEALQELFKCLDGNDVAQAKKVGIRAAEKLDALVGRSGKVVDAVINLGRVNRQIKERHILEELLGDK